MGSERYNKTKIMSSWNSTTISFRVTIQIQIPIMGREIWLNFSSLASKISFGIRTLKNQTFFSVCTKNHSPPHGRWKSIYPNGLKLFSPPWATPSVFQGFCREPFPLLVQTQCWSSKSWPFYCAYHGEQKNKNYMHGFHYWSFENMEEKKSSFCVVKSSW